ncbi:hypothetical protein Golob_026047 [Gossypium lobatum]|uniref:Uncharacterized protein n=1 Tax=Gossypium lobatum TaxID=34289 RepID=A0A7J8LTX7_9ROSI|nr:hypothetical protein [Gossypium lobatum]
MGSSFYLVAINESLLRQIILKLPRSYLI